VSGYQSFSAVGNANTTYYVIANQSASEWEVGIGTYTASGTTLSRDTVLSSSNSGSLVNFSAGTKDVFVDYPAGRAVFENEAGNVDGFPITGGTINNTVIGGTTPAAGTFTTLTATGQTSLGGAAGSEGLRITTTASAANYLLGRGQISGNNPSLRSAGSDTNVSLLLGSQNAGNIRFLTNSLNDEQLRISHTASAVNYVQVTGAATGGSPVVSAQGSDANVGLAINSKGAGTLLFQTNGTTRASINSGATFSAGILASGVPAFVAAATAGQVNYLQANGSATGGGLQFQAIGSDTNISQVFQSKGTGAIDLAAGSSGVNISNGGTVTAITRTANGSGYTTAPSANITAPTTAGGVQAVLQTTMYLVDVPTIAGGGTGYTVGNVLTFVGGTFTTAAQVTVATVSAGVITSIAVTTNGTYTALPSNPVSVTGGTGSGATFTVNWRVFGCNITNAGSGYVEQPTVTFSGGGGSGAAAYATVGSGTIIRSLGLTGTQSLSFYTPSGESLRIRDTGSTGAYAMFSNTAAGATLLTQGTSNAFMSINSNGTSSVIFGTNGNSGTTQMTVSHTASAVNFVQVTGASTTNAPVISGQGTDTDVGINFRMKGAAGLRVQNASGLDLFRVTGNSGTVANYVRANGSLTGVAPFLSADGTDTNIDLSLTPKGTGLVRFGTYTAGAPTATGYISIKTADGTTYKVLVGT
jgi:hypothetical protein